MTFHVVNHGGRIVAIDDEEQYKVLLKQGFRSATAQEEREFVESRRALVAQMQKGQEMEMTGLSSEGIYFATVSQSGSDGYAVSSEAIMKELSALGVNVSPYNKGQNIGILYHNPYSILQMENNFRILYTMFESTKLPDDWKDYLEAADMIIVPSHWNQEVFHKCGFDTKVVPLGYNDKHYQYIDRSKDRVGKPFTFLHYNAYNLRKGFIEVFNAFNKAFKPDENVKLLLKTTLKKVPFPIIESQYPNIEVIEGAFDTNQMNQLMGASDCFVFPSRGEGFGMTPLEAMATGMPAIVPNAHGISEYFNDRYMYEVKVKEMCPATYDRYKGQDVGEMYVSDEDDLARQMRYIYEHQDEASQKGKAASEYVKQWTFEKTALLLKDIILANINRPVNDKPIKNSLPLVEV
jgi:glycosyltransferase involved in cell wall biosynthesis